MKIESYFANQYAPRNALAFYHIIMCKCKTCLPGPREAIASKRPTNGSNPVWTSREAPHQRPDAQLQDSRAARGQRVRRRGAQVRAHAAADHGRGESDPHP